MTETRGDFVKQDTTGMRFFAAGYDVEVNVATWEELEHGVCDRLTRGEGFSLATLNLDHLVKLRAEPAFRDAYAAQDLVVADGNPVVWLSRLAGRPVDLIPGSDAILPLARIAAQLGCPIALVGSTEDTLAAARDYLEKTVPGAEVCFTVSPPFGFDPTGDLAEKILGDLCAAGAGLVFVALGAPKQELFAAFGRRRLSETGFVSIGAGLDFFSGAQRRAPPWVRRIAMEWLWRALSQPFRLVPRYARCITILPSEIRHALALRRQDGPARPPPRHPRGHG